MRPRAGVVVGVGGRAGTHCARGSVGGGALEQISLWPRFMVEPTGEEGESAESKGVIAAGSTAWLAALSNAAGNRGVSRREERKQHVETRELEQRAQIVVQPGEPEIAAELAETLAERHQSTQSGAIDVGRAREIDDHHACALLDGVKNGLFEVLSIGHD